MASQIPHVRTATHDDLDALVTIYLEAMSLDPAWDYIHSHRHQYPEDNHACARELLKQMLETEGIRLMVATLPSLNATETQCPVGIAMWLNPNQMETEPKHFAQDTSLRRHISPAREKAFGDENAKSKRVFFEEPYGSHRLHLGMLATHPDYQKRGVGTALCNWGIEWAREQGKSISLFCSPMGRGVYSKLGFQYLGEYTVQIEGEEEKATRGAMILPCKP